MDLSVRFSIKFITLSQNQHWVNSLYPLFPWLYSTGTTAARLYSREHRITETNDHWWNSRDRDTGDNSDDERRGRGTKKKEKRNERKPRSKNILQEESMAEEVVSCGRIITGRPSSMSSFKRRMKGRGNGSRSMVQEGLEGRREIQRGSVLQLI